jgi:voltage-gated sodium channel
MTRGTSAGPDFRARLGAWIESRLVQRVVVALIAINAVTLGLETWPAAMAAAGPALLALDAFILGVFVVELALKLLAQGAGFFRRPWNLFDSAIVGIALAPAAEGFAVLRALRVLRLLRLVSVVPQMRLVVESVVRALPGMGSIALLLALFFYIFAVMATKLFGAAHPGWFGSLGTSMFTLFQIMTLEGWAEIAREVMAVTPAAWLFFILFILLATFTVLNLFIAIIVNTMQQQHDSIAQEEAAARQEPLELELSGLRAELALLRERLPPPSRPPG